MPLEPPSFGSQGYWNQRFTTNSNPFEWLEEPTALDPFILDALRDSTKNNPQLLHIGCGTSLLSYLLRSYVDDPRQIHNLDYSEVAINLGRKREVEIHKGNGVLDEEELMGTNILKKAALEEDNTSGQSDEVPHSQTTYMRWDAADLLDPKSVLHVCKPETYRIIVDKSTSDSIACSDDIDVALPYPVGIRSDTPMKFNLRRSGPLHPLQIMAVHLARTTERGGRWISLSYSQDRYPFFNLFEKIPQDVIDNGFPDPSLLWRMMSKHEIETPERQPSEGSGGGSITHRPKELHYVYVLERTDTPLFMRGDHI